MTKNHQKPFTVGKPAGFTLIELLVVVLIIGVLASVALPQYEVAVEKSRLATVMQNTKTIKEMADLYYLANGKYEDDMSVMDISNIGGCVDKGEGQLHCANKGWYDWKYDSHGAAWAAVGYTAPFGKHRTAYLIYGAYNSRTPGARECWATQSDEVALRVCRSLGGEPIREERCRSTQVMCTVFKLP